MFAEADMENTYIGRTGRFRPNMHDANTNISALEDFTWADET
jgi:hypothetical protein